VTSNLRKVVLPVAGLGTRFLPATKTIPKEMLPIVDKPLIQYAIEEAVVAGFKEFIFVTRQDKSFIEKHFKKDVDLEQELSASGKQNLVDAINTFTSDEFNFLSVIQEKPLGLGHAILCAKEVVGNETFAVILPDDLIDDGDRGCLKQMRDIYEEFQNNIIAVEQVPVDETDKYGIVSTNDKNGSVKEMTAIVEKPGPEVAPSNLAVVGRYILSPQIFEMLEITEKGAGGEIQLTDAIAMLIEYEQVLAYEFEGKRFDCGSKLGFLQANIEYGLKHSDLNEDFSTFIYSISK